MEQKPLPLPWRLILDDGAPGILTVEQVAELLKVTREEDPGMLAYVAIGLFAGLRRSELCALEWSEIDLQARTIEIKGVKAKTRQRRIVTISDTLAEWFCTGTEVAGTPVREPRTVIRFRENNETRRFKCLCSYMKASDPFKSVL